MRARYDIYLQNYAKVLHIEAHTMVSMAQKDILPAALRYSRELAETIIAKREALPYRPGLDVETDLLQDINDLTENFDKQLKALRRALDEADRADWSAQGRAEFYRDTVIPVMEELRAFADGLEVQIGRAHV